MKANGRERARREAPPRERVAEVQDEDATLVQRAIAGDHWAEDALYRRHAPVVTRICTRIMGREADADDVVQDTFLLAFQKLADLREPTSLRPWLIRIAVHRARRKLRSRRLWEFFGLDSETRPDQLGLCAHDHTRPDLRLELAIVERVLTREPAELRIAWVLHRLEGLSLKETAETSRRSLATVKRYVSAVDARIERALGEDHA